MNTILCLLTKPLKSSPEASARPQIGGHHLIASSDHVAPARGLAPEPLPRPTRTLSYFA